MAKLKEILSKTGNKWLGPGGALAGTIIWQAVEREGLGGLAVALGAFGVWTVGAIFERFKS